MALTTYFRLFFCVYGGWVGGGWRYVLQGPKMLFSTFKNNFFFKYGIDHLSSVCLSVCIGVGEGGGGWCYQLQGPYTSTEAKSKITDWAIKSTLA